MTAGNIMSSVDVHPYHPFLHFMCADYNIKKRLYVYRLMVSNQCFVNVCILGRSSSLSSCVPLHVCRIQSRPTFNRHFLLIMSTLLLYHYCCETILYMAAVWRDELAQTQKLLRKTSPSLRHFWRWGNVDTKNCLKLPKYLRKCHGLFGSFSKENKW